MVETPQETSQRIKGTTPELGRASRLRQRATRRRVGGGRAGGGFSALLKWAVVALVGLIVVGLIATPLVYRSLRPQLRESIKHRLPFMAAFDPQREYQANTLPTVVPQADDAVPAADLLLTPDGVSPAVMMQPTEEQPALPTPNEQGLIIITATPSPVPTEAPTQTLVPEQEVTLPPTEVPPTLTPTATLAPPTEVPATAVALLPSARLYGFEHIYQTWNNCGPATLTMALSYYGWTEDQAVAASMLKPDAEDKNVSPWQMVEFVNENTGVKALYRMGGDLDMIRRLILEGFPVIVETGYMPEGYDWMGHYRLVIAYDDLLQEMYVYDSFLGHGNFQGLPVSYDHFDELWQHFNRTYIVIYDAAREADLRRVLGEQVDLRANYQHALEVARQEAAAEPDNPFAWFNMGTSYVGLEMYEEAALAYDQARNAGPGLPWRMLWYQFGPFKAYYEVGRYDDVLALVQANLGTTPYVEETYYWTGMVYMARGQYGPARNQFNVALQHNRNFQPARDALDQLALAEASGASNG
ncbi:MAG: hypothetical protein Kow0077_06370 [Anaerolineae bacterium]